MHGIFLGHDEINYPFERYMPYLHIDIAVADAVPSSGAQRRFMESLSGFLQDGKRAIRAAATVAAAETSKSYSSYALRHLHLNGAPVFSRTNGAALLIDGRKRVVTMAPNVRAVRLRVSNPVGSNGGAIELESPPNAEWRQSIGATANDRATLRCDRIAETAATAGDHEVVLRVRNAVGPSECILTVRVADTAPAFPKAAVRARRLTVGTAASIAFDKATGGNGALTCALDAAPEGMAFDAAARTLSGTPGEAQAAATYTCTATDEDGDEATQTVSVTVVVAG